MRGQEATAVVIDKPARAKLVQVRREELGERLGAEWIAGANEGWRRRTGRPMQPGWPWLRCSGVGGDPIDAELD